MANDPVDLLTTKRGGWQRSSLKEKGKKSSKVGKFEQKGFDHNLTYPLLLFLNNLFWRILNIKLTE